MNPPSPEVRAELEPLLRANRRRLGEVFALVERGWTDDRIAKELGVSTSGFVSNNRNIIRALLEARIPNGPSMAAQAASAVRGTVRGAQLSPEAATYVEELLAVLTRLQAPGVEAPRPRHDPTVARSRSAPTEVPLRVQVHRVVRERCADLIDRIMGETSVEPTDYHRVLIADFAPDAVWRLIVLNATSATSRALDRAGRHDLTIEHSVTEWAGDLPVSQDVIEAAQARLDWWRTHD